MPGAHTLKTAVAIAMAVLIWCGQSAAQGWRYDSVAQTTTLIGASTTPVSKPLAGATITFCAHPANAVPCTNLATVYSDITLLTPVSGSVVTADAQGNFGAYMTTGVIYDYTISAVGYAAAGPYVVVAGVTLAGANTFTGATSLWKFDDCSSFATTLLCQTDASTAKGMLLPFSYSATAFTNPSNVPVVDLRRNDWRGWLLVTDWGAKCDGVTDDTTAINNVINYGETLVSGATIVFPGGGRTCVHATGFTNWAKPNMRYIGNGVRLKFTGTGKQIYLHNATEVDNLYIESFVFQGNPNATHALYSDTLIARSRFRDILNAQDFNTACFYFAVLQLSEIDNISCSGLKATNMGTPQVTIPVNGMIAGDVGLPFANNTVIQADMEGVSGIGLWLKSATNGCHWSSGTSEDNATGIQMDAASWGNTFVGFDTEANTVRDVLESGSRNIYINHISTGTFSFVVSTTPELSHGLYNSIVVDGNSTSVNVHDLTYNNSGTGAITLNGNPFGAMFWHIYNKQTGALYESPNAYFSLSGIEISHLNGNAAQRNYSFIPDGTNNGYFELWKSTTSTGFPINGTPIMQFDASANVVFTGTHAWGGGTALTTSNSTGSGSIVLAGSPTLTGTVGAAAITATGAVSAGTFTEAASKFVLDANGKITTYNNVATLANGVSQLVAAVNTTGLTANVGSTLLYAVPAAQAGMYRVSCYVVLTTAGTTSTLPACAAGWTDNDTGVAVGNFSFTPTNAGNVIGTTSSAQVAGGPGTMTFNAKASTNINYATSGYASTGTAMQYAVHVKLEFLGN